MQMHVDHLVPDLELESDVRLKAGSFLITRKELPGGRLNEKVIESIRRFASQLAPVPFKVNIKADELALNQLKGVLDQDLNQITEKIAEGKEYPNFLDGEQLKDKVMRIMEKLISNPDLIRYMYEFKIGGSENDNVITQLHDHSIRVTLLSIAIGLKLRWSIISLVNVGMAGILHDMGIIRTEAFPNLQELDELLPNELEAYVEEHQKLSVDLFGEQKVTLLPFTKQEIVHMIANHHRPDFNDMRHKTTILLFFAELLDEMITLMPHKVRYNFSPDQVKKLGDKFARRNGLMNVLLALIKLYKGKGFAWQIVSSIISLFSMDELLIEGYEEKLKEIVNFCPFKCAVPYPPAGGNALPRTIYCNNSLSEEFSCEHMSQVKIEIYVGSGKVKAYKKCGTLTERVHQLNKAGRAEAENMKREKAAKKADKADESPEVKKVEETVKAEASEEESKEDKNKKEKSD
jgi:hypothetical protein